MSQRAPLTYDPAGVVASVDLAYRLRNRIVHQGIRVDHEDATKVWESVNFVLKTALNLRDVKPPPATLSWGLRFKRVRKEVKRFASENQLRLVMRCPSADTPFTLELFEDQLHVSCASDMSQPVASAFMRIMWDSWQRQRMPDRPRLIMGPPSGILLSGSLNWLVDAVNKSIGLCEALKAFAKGDTALRVAKLGSSGTIALLSAMPKLDPNDARQTGLSAHLAAYLSILPRASISARLRPLKQIQPEVARLAKEWAGSMASLNPSDDHSRCGVLRRIHADAFWLDSIWVSCPIEGVTFGSQQRPMT